MLKKLEISEKIGEKTAPDLPLLRRAYFVESEAPAHAEKAPTGCRCVAERMDARERPLAMMESLAVVRN